MVSVEYLAGIIDGEGSLSLNRIPRGQSYHEYCVRITISNTNRAILKEIMEDWGGTIHSMGVRRSGWKPGFVLIWTNAAGARLLYRAHRYLRVKSQHAVALLEFTEHLQKCVRRRDELGRLLPYPRHVMEIREAFFRRLRQLNQKGVGHPELQGDLKPDYERIRLREAGISPRYLAGFVDGEGSVMITKSRSRKSGCVQYRARLTVSNTDRGILEEICRDFGGTIHKVGRGKSTWKPGYMLVFTDGLIPSLLSVLRPHLRLKRRQAAVQLEFIHHKKNTARTLNGRFLVRLPPGVVQFRESLYRAMKALNARGVVPS